MLRQQVKIVIQDKNYFNCIQVILWDFIIRVWIKVSVELTPLILGRTNSTKFLKRNPILYYQRVSGDFLQSLLCISVGKRVGCLSIRNGISQNNYSSEYCLHCHRKENGLILNLFKVIYLFNTFFTILTNP
jgi:hypothetical protein